MYGVGEWPQFCFVAGQSRTPPRAKSVDRDSVISESLLSASPGKRMTSSTDSIPDSGMGTLHQSEREILRERIIHLEKQLKVFDNVPLLIVMNLNTNTNRGAIVERDYFVLYWLINVSIIDKRKRIKPRSDQSARVRCRWYFTDNGGTTGQDTTSAGRCEIKGCRTGSITLCCKRKGKYL